MPAVQIADPTAVSVEIDVINRSHHFPPLRSAWPYLPLAMPKLTVDRRGNRILPVDQVGKSDPMLARKGPMQSPLLELAAYPR